MNRILNLKNYPIKQIPSKLIYKLKEYPRMNPPLTEYVMFSTKKGDKSFGRIVLGKMKNYGQWRDDYTTEPFLLIYFLSSNPRKNGFGKAMIDFAKNYSKQNGCNGYIMLKATSIFENTPHLFYRKQNFSTLDAKLDKKMDQFIKANKEATASDFRDMLMHYPPRIDNSKQNWVQKILKYFFNK